LPDEFLQPLRPQLKLKRRIILDRSGGDEPVFEIGIFSYGRHLADVNTKRTDVAATVAY
jgi:hypothetical protein